MYSSDHGNNTLPDASTWSSHNFMVASQHDYASPSYGYGQGEALMEGTGHLLNLLYKHTQARFQLGTAPRSDTEFGRPERPRKSKEKKTRQKDRNSSDDLAQDVGDEPWNGLRDDQDDRNVRLNQTVSDPTLTNLLDSRNLNGVMKQR
ncbi:hypothetical protein PG996_005507 [Apiospora saccharicola]|uniref:Uncharacterized protein n=1 Tax=Apiospora saccharicola TaxID=335842 RepID=A0ABR1VLN1_9PEZI